MSKHHSTTNEANLSAQIAAFPHFLIDAFIVWRVASFLTFRAGFYGKIGHRSEAGPFGVFTKFREMIGIVIDQETQGAWHAEQKNEVAKIFTCMSCSTTWIALVVAILRGRGFGYALALSTAALIVERKG